jgi:tRNA-dihydrouridine synthase
MPLSTEVPLAEHIKQNVPNLLVGAVGIITDPIQSEEILQKSQADVIFMARQVLRDVDFPLRAAQELGAAIQPIVQYERGWSRMMVPREHNLAGAEKKGVSEVEGEEGREGRGQGHGKKIEGSGEVPRAAKV